MAVVSTIRNRAKEPDQVCADAVDLARQSLAETAGVIPDTVGDHLGVEATGDRVVTHFFDCTDRAYAGWRWAVTVTRAPRSKLVTVDESVLLPGPDALLAPAWVPWQDRLRPGDVGIGDLLPASPDDERLVPFVVLDGDDAVTDWFLPRTDTENEDAGPRIAEELPSPGRSRVLSAFGRDDTAERWYESDHGPRTPLSHAAPAHCLSCGFFVPLSGGLGRLFGACGNAYRAGRRPGGVRRPRVRRALGGGAHRVGRAGDRAGDRRVRLRPGGLARRLGRGDRVRAAVPRHVPRGEAELA